MDGLKLIALSVNLGFSCPYFVTRPDMNRNRWALWAVHGHLTQMNSFLISIAFYQITTHLYYNSVLAYKIWITLVRSSAGSEYEYIGRMPLSRYLRQKLIWYSERRYCSENCQRVSLSISCSRKLIIEWRCSNSLCLTSCKPKWWMGI